MKFKYSEWCKKINRVLDLEFRINSGDLSFEDFKKGQYVEYIKRLSLSKKDEKILFRSMKQIDKKLKIDLM